MKSMKGTKRMKEGDRTMEALADQRLVLGCE
jgi:hypothetical protein